MTPSIGFLLLDRGGGGRIRSQFPAAALAEKGWTTGAKSKIEPGEFDILVLHRPHRAEHLALLRSQHERGGFVLVQEDDDLTAVPTAGIDNGIKRAYTPQLVKRHDTCIQEADGLIASTPRLAEVYGQLAQRTWVVRNYLPRWVRDTVKRKDDGKVRVQWGGRVATHLAALQWLAPEMDRALEGAVFVTVGDAHKTTRALDYHGEAEVHAYVADAKQYYRALSKADIGIVPLVPGEGLNLAKSALKGQEAFALGQPVVAADTPEYRWLNSEPLTRPLLLASSPKQFADHVRLLIHDRDLRESMAEWAALRADGLWLEDHIGEWEAVFHDLPALRRSSREGVPEVQSGVLPRDVAGPEVLPVLQAAAKGAGRRVKLTQVPKIAVAIPCRGTVHSRMVESVLEALEQVESEGKAKRVLSWWAFSHGEPIPQSHEKAAERALATGAELVWFVEEDNLPPPEALSLLVDRMRETGAGLVAIPYPVGEPKPVGDGTRWSTIYREHGEILFTGLGITLVHRDVFDRVPKPWFRTDRQMGPDRKLSIKRPYTAGGIDVAFGLRVREAGFTLAETPGIVGGHIRTVKHGERPFNRSPHTVEIWDTIDREQHIFRDQDSSRFKPANWKKQFDRLSRPIPWIGRYQIDGEWYGNPKPDAFDPIHDPRIKLCTDYFKTATSVLELGSLEGGHTAALAGWADHVLGIEARTQSLRKSALVLQALGIRNAKTKQGDLEKANLASLGTFDLVFSVGVLYHMPNPIHLLDEMAAAAPRLFLWTHVSPTSTTYQYQEHGIRDPLSGLSPTSTWLPKATLLDHLAQRYTTVEVLSEDMDHKAGPALVVAAKR